jgi:hypothetical protein
VSLMFLVSSPRNGTSCENRSYYEKNINGTKYPTQRLKSFGTICNYMQLFATMQLKQLYGTYATLRNFIATYATILQLM